MNDFPEPTEIPRSAAARWADRLTVGGVGLLALLLYLRTLAPSVIAEDSGELITAAATWGICHPPGYPLWCLLAHLFTLLPVGSIAYRANLLSAVCGAVAVALVTLLVRRAGAPRPAAIAAGLLLAASGTFWSQAIIAEVYTLNVALALGVLVALQRWRATGRERTLLMAFGLFGLSLANHYMLMLLLLPGYLVYGLWPRTEEEGRGRKETEGEAHAETRRRGGERKEGEGGGWRGRDGEIVSRVKGRGSPAESSVTRHSSLVTRHSPPDTLDILGTLDTIRSSPWLRRAVWGLAPLLLYLYLPLCAGADPAMNWGDPSTWRTFWEHVLRTSYRSLELGEVVPTQIKLLFAVHFLGLWLRQFTPAVLLLAGPGLAWWARRDRPLAMASLLLFAGNTVVLLGVLHFAFTGDNQQRVTPYYLPAYAVTALWLGGGLAAGVEALRARSGGKRREEEGAEETNHSSVFGDGFSVIGIPDPDNRQPTTSGSSGSSLIPHPSSLILHPFRLALASVLVLLLPFLPLRAHWADHDRSQDWLAYDFNQAALAQVAPQALLMPSGDHRTFPLAYLIYVKGQRPDVLLGDIYGTLHLRLLREYRRVTGDKELRTQAEILTALIKKERRPIYYTLKGDFPNVPGYRVQPEGLWYRVVRAPSPRKSPRFTLPGSVRGLHPQGPVPDEMNRALLVDYEFFRGLTAFERQQPQVGKAAFQRAEAWAEGDKEALNNLGSACAEYGLVERAAELYRTALAIYPDYPMAQENLAKLSQREAEEAPGSEKAGLTPGPEQFRPPEPPAKPGIPNLGPSMPELPGPAAAALGLGGNGSKP